MSHIAKIDIQFQDINCIIETAKRLNYEYKQVSNFKFYDGTTATGTAVHLPNWKYPVVITEDGEAIYDDYGGSWGNREYLNKFKQIYGVEVAKKQARIKGYSCREVQLEDGKIKLYVNV